MGYVAPTIFQEWGVPRSALGNVLAAGNFGVLLGSLVFTMVADKVGRRPVLLGATVFFSLLTLMTARVTSVQQLRSSASSPGSVSVASSRTRRR